MTPADFDTHAAQAERVADYLERNPGGRTLAELYAACDLGCASKVLSAMRRRLGYGIGRGPTRCVPCVDGTKRRNVRTYILLHRPAKLAQLPLDL